MRVAINGAGIAGGCLAYWLERSGHDVVLIEKAPQFRTGGYGVDFWGVGYTVAERMGILPEVRAHGYTFREVRDVDQRGRKVGGFSTDSLRKSLMGRFTSVPRGDLADAIIIHVTDLIHRGDDLRACPAGIRENLMQNGLPLRGIVRLGAS